MGSVIERRQLRARIPTRRATLAPAEKAEKAEKAENPALSVSSFAGATLIVRT